MAEDAGSPVFANRYRFQTVGNDWDRGRSGYTHLVFDLKKERLGVIKRAELESQQAVLGLRNEVAALTALKGLGVPQVYDTGETAYGSKKYFYVVIEYINAMRIEKHIAVLTPSERAQILTQLFSLLAKSHRLGIVNGDVDLKHLFWLRDMKQLVVIDWGNAKLNVDPKNKAEFAYDLARSAEIIYALVTRKGQPPPTGSIALSDDSQLIPDLIPIPPEYRTLCMWAPRTRPDSAQPPYTAEELYDFSNKWCLTIERTKQFESIAPKSARKIHSLVAGFLLVVCFIVLFLTVYKLYGFPIPFGNPTPIVNATETSTSTSAPPTSTPVSTVTLSPTVTSTFTPSFTSTLPVYSQVVFDVSRKSDSCWHNEAVAPAKLVRNDGFYKRAENGWGFRVQDDHSSDDIVQADLAPCISKSQQVAGIALNTVILRLEVPTYEPAREFGIFLINEHGQRREYTLLMDKDEKMYLRVREDNKVTDTLVLVVSSNLLHLEEDYPRSFYRFPIQIYLQLNNQGSDVLYLLSTSEGPVNAQDINPSQMIPVDNAKLPTFGNIQKIGLVGHGGQTEVLIWPLVIFSR